MSTATATKPAAKPKAKPAKKAPASPPLPTELWTGEINHALLRRIIKCVGCAASHDEGRPILCGVHIVNTAEKLVVEATDSYRLHRFEGVSLGPNDLDLLVPARWLDRFAKEPIPWTPKNEHATVRITVKTDPLGTRVEFAWAGETSSVPALVTNPAPGDRRFPTAAHLIPTGGTPTPVKVAYNPTYFKALMNAARTFGGSTELPIRTTVQDGIKPSMFEVVGGDGLLQLLLMPVRVP